MAAPASILAVYQEPPPPPALPIYTTIDALKATPADVHGKSTFHLRWPKSGDAVQHYVYRALDATLFAVDNARRAGGDTANYNRFIDEGYDPADVDALTRIVHKQDPEVASSQYASLSPTQVYLLARLEENEAAFTRINRTPVGEDDAVHQDRDTAIPNPQTGSNYTPDANTLLYEDATLDGRSTNRYFYKTQTVGLNGLTSPLSAPTLPVECPLVTPAAQPVITSVAGGDKQVTISWANRQAPGLIGYLVYRTTEKRHASDWRRMELVLPADDAVFSVTDLHAQAETTISYQDDSAVPTQLYYYTVIAVSETEAGKWLRSEPSVPKSGQAYDQTPPPPPAFDAASSAWVYVDDNDAIFEWDDDLAPAVNPQPAVRVVWAKEATSTLVQIARQPIGSYSGLVLLNFEEGESYDAGHQMLLDRDADVNAGYTYTAKSKSAAGLLSTEESELEILHP